MVKKVNILSFVLLFSLVFISISSANSWLRTDKIRASYIYSYQDEEHVCFLKKAGFNTILVKINGFNDYSNIKKWAQIAKKYNLHFYPILNFAGKQELDITAGKFRHEIVRSGAEQERTPCPLDKNYWDIVIKERLQEIARVSKDTPIDGVLIDLEMYGANHLSYNRNSCFCDNCFSAFLNSKGMTKEISPEKRWDWLVQNGYESDYYDVLETRLELLARSSIQETVNEFPDLMVGFLHYFDLWFYNGLAKAWGTRKNPVLIWSEETYSTGYTDYISKTQELIASKGINSYFISGIWIGQFYPTHIPAHIYYMSKESTGGYWLWTSYSLWKEPEKLKGAYRIPATQEEFWNALTFANQEIARHIESGGKYDSDLAIEPQPPVILPTEEISDYRPPILQPLNTNAEYIVGEPQTRLRRKNFIHFYPEDGNILLEIAGVQIGKYPDYITYNVVDSEGEIVLSGHLDPKEKKVFELAANKGVYTAIIDAGRNGFSINMDSRCVVYEASEQNKLRCIYESCPLFFYVPAGCKEFWMNVATEGPTETAQLQIIDPSGNIIKDQFVDSEMRLNVAVADEQHGIWSFNYSKAQTGILEDVYKIYFSKDIPPYVSDHPNRLLIK